MKHILYYLVMIAACNAINSSSFATTYYFSTSGSDSNSGLSSASAKQTITAAKALMLSGNTILFKRGDTWYMPMDTLALGGKSNVTIDAYGIATNPRPVLAGTFLLTNWTYTGSNNVWSCPLTPYARAHRVWVSGISRINLAVKNGKSDTLSDLTSTNEYFIDNPNSTSAVLYIKTNSATTAPTNVTVIPGTVLITGRPIATITNSTNINIRNIEFRGGGKGEVLKVLAPSSDITFDNCIIGRATLHGLVVMSPSGSTEVVSNIQVLNCIIDKSWPPAENDIKTTIEFDDAINGDGLALWSGINGGLIKGNYVTNWGHTGITMTTYQDATAANFGVQYVKVEQNECVAGNSMYMHPFGMIGFEGKVKFNIVKRNYFHNYSAASTIGGNYNYVFSNIFANVTTSPHPKAKKSPWGVNLTTWEVPAGSGKSFVCRDNYIANNTFYNTSTHSILASQNYYPGADTLNVRDNKIYNNLMIDFGTDTVTSLPAPKNSVALYITANVAQGRTFIRNNNFWASYDTTNNKRVAQYENQLFTVSTLNGCGPCNPAYSTNNVAFNPRFKSGGFFELSDFSHSTLRSGGHNYEAIITAHGLPAGEFVDYNGVAWPANPSIGAVQYVTP